MKVLVAGVGNVLRGDDGFGVVVAERLMQEPLPDGVRVVEVGIGGIHLVQELLDGFDALVVIDAVDLGRPPGSVVVMRPDVLDVADLPLGERHDQLADMHYATPERAFMLARALDRLPRSTWLVGCQTADTERYGETLSPAVRGAVGVAVAEVRALIGGFSLAPPGSSKATKEEEMELHRKTETGDELTDEHSIAAEEEGRPEKPYRPPRQPAQQQPEEEAEDGKDTRY